MPYQENPALWAAQTKQFELVKEINALRGSKNMTPLTIDEEQEIQNALLSRYQESNLKKLDFNEIEKINISDISTNAYSKFGPAPVYGVSESIQGLGNLIGAGGLAGAEALRRNLDAEIVSEENSNKEILTSAALIDQANLRSAGKLTKTALKGAGSAASKAIDWLANWDEKITSKATGLGEKIAAGSAGKTAASAVAGRVAGGAIKGGAQLAGASLGVSGLGPMYGANVIPLPRVQSFTSWLPGYADSKYDQETVWSNPSSLISSEGWSGQLVDQYRAATMPNGSDIEKRMGNSDPFGYSGTVDWWMDATGMSGRKLKGKSDLETAQFYYNDLMNNEEYQQLNPVISGIYKGVQDLALVKDSRDGTGDTMESLAQYGP